VLGICCTHSVWQHQPTFPDAQDQTPSMTVHDAHSSLHSVKIHSNTKSFN